jgi:hypothetical protein
MGQEHTTDRNEFADKNHTRMVYSTSGASLFSSPRLKFCPGASDGYLHSTSLRSITHFHWQGNRWFIGAMNDSKSRTLEVPLNFLGSGKYTLHYFADAPDASDLPDRIAVGSRDILSSEHLTIQMAPGGGFAGILTLTP